MISVLFARRDSIYKQLGCDVWDQDRDVRNYKGTGPVICHPPCRLWGRLRWAVNEHDPMENLWPWYCIDLIDAYGGVLEHPITSKVWKRIKPTTVVDQFWYGHRAQKRTGLYINGIIPPIPFSLSTPTWCVGANSALAKKRMAAGTGRGWIPKSVSKKEAEATPVEFARWLIECCDV